MKRIGQVMPLIADLENLREAFLRAAKGKSGKREVIQFRCHLEVHLWNLHLRLLTGDYTFGKYHYFQIYDPKCRTICAASFDERVVQHAMMRILHPVFDRYQIYNSFACRLGKGTYKAVEKAQEYVKRFRWFVKMDVRKFFDSIDHQILKGQLHHLFKDPLLLDLLHQLVDSYELGSEKGLPIGNLSSQYFANHYLAGADHYALEVLHVDGMVRYMDDIVLFGNNATTLKEQAEAVTCYLMEKLMLTMHQPVMNQSHFGLPFLGYVISPHKLWLNTRSRRRFRFQTARLENLRQNGWVTDDEYRIRYTTMCAFIEKAQTRPFLESLQKNMTVSIRL